MPPTAVFQALSNIPQHPDRVLLPIQGCLPSYISASTLYRTGPAVFDLQYADGKPFTVQHWFDGLGILHAFHLDPVTNSVEYHSRYTAPSRHELIKNNPSNISLPINFASPDPCRSALGNLFQVLVPTKVDPHSGKRIDPNLSVTVQNVAGVGPCVRTDFNRSGKIDEDTLEISHFFDFSDSHIQLKGNYAPAHGYFDSATNEFFAFTFRIGQPVVTYNVFKTDEHSKNATILASFSAPAAYIHSFAVTDNYLILAIWPLKVNGLKVLATRSFYGGCHFDRKVKTKYFVVDRNGGGLVAVYEGDPYFCFHQINAREVDDSIEIDLVKFDDDTVLKDFALKKLRNSTSFSQCNISRFTLPNLSDAISAGPKTAHSVLEHALSDCSIELPRINPNHSRTDYSFVYGVSRKYTLMDSIAKINVKTGEKTLWNLRENCLAGEPIFVPKPGGDEDEGCILTVVLDGDKEESSLFVLDAKSMQQIARATVPNVITMGFHGMLKSTL